MADPPVHLADIIEANLAENWRRHKSLFLKSVGLVGGEHSQSLYIAPVRTLNPTQYVEDLATQVDPNERRVILVGESGQSDKSPIVLAFPVSKKVHLGESPQVLRNALRALFIEVHSRLVTWWLVNAWRSKQLAEATWSLSDAMQIIPAAACARSLIETAA